VGTKISWWTTPLEKHRNVDHLGLIFQNTKMVKIPQTCASHFVLFGGKIQLTQYCGNAAFSAIQDGSFGILSAVEPQTK